MKAKEIFGIIKRLYPDILSIKDDKFGGVIIKYMKESDSTPWYQTLKNIDVEWPDDSKIFPPEKIYAPCPFCKKEMVKIDNTINHPCIKNCALSNSVFKAELWPQLNRTDKKSLTVVTLNSGESSEVEKSFEDIIEAFLILKNHCIDYDSQDDEILEILKGLDDPIETIKSQINKNDSPRTIKDRLSILESALEVEKNACSTCDDYGKIADTNNDGIAGNCPNCNENPSLETLGIDPVEIWEDKDAKYFAIDKNGEGHVYCSEPYYTLTEWKSPSGCYYLHAHYHSYNRTTVNLPPNIDWRKCIWKRPNER